MKVTIEFEEQDSAIDALRARDYKFVIWQMSQELRKYYKYSEDEHEIKVAEKLNDYLNQLLYDNKINIE
jgi:hypothetical protein